MAARIPNRRSSRCHPRLVLRLLNYPKTMNQEKTDSELFARLATLMADERRHLLALLEGGTILECSRSKTTGGTDPRSWTRIEDGLPDDGQEVWFFRHGIVHLGFWRAAVPHFECNGNRYWAATENVTHWMPCDERPGVPLDPALSRAQSKASAPTVAGLDSIGL